MFDLHKIVLTNFRSYLGAQEFVFPAVTGLYFFTGENNTALGSNGAGKSSLLDAIVWVLYGRTSRGLKASDVISWGANTCQVVLELTVGENRLVVKRSQKPNILTLDDTPLDQKDLEKHIRLNYESFLYSVVNAQFGTSFLSLSPSEKLTLFSDIYNLDYWLQRSDEAARKATQIDVQINAIKDNINASNGRISGCEEDLIFFKKELLAHSSVQKVKILAKEKELARVTNDVISLDEKMLEINSDNEGRLKKAEAMLEQWIKEVSKYSQEKAHVQGRIKGFEDQLKEIKALKGKCPVCLQDIDRQNQQKHVSNLVRQISCLVLDVSTIEDDIKRVLKFIVRTKVKISSINNELFEAKDKKSEAKMLHAKQVRLSEELTALKEEKNPNEGIIEHLELRIADCKKALTIDKETLSLKEAEYESVNFWAKGFKRVRLFLIERAFRTLEIEVNNSLVQLGMPDWQITFDIERENKSGGITKGFVVFVKSPANSEPVRWENWSGGETQRLQLAGNLGLANLIMRRAGLSNSIEFYDEPSTHLSQQGMMDLANLLYERATTERKKIWIVDHTSVTNFGEFEGIITVRKSENGSVITYNSN